MKNFKRISPRRLKKLLKNYQRQIVDSSKMAKFFQQEDVRHLNMWVEQLEINRVFRKKYLIIICVLSVLLIFDSLLLFISYYLN